MAAKKTATPEPVAEPVAQTAELPVTESTSLTLEQLIASRKELEAQIKALKGTAKPARKEASLADVVAKQHELPGRWVCLGIAAHVNERIQAGQDAEEALSQVAFRYAAIVRDVFATRAEAESLQDAVWRHLAESYPKTNGRTGPGSVAKASAAEPQPEPVEKTA